MTLVPGIVAKNPGCGWPGFFFYDLSLGLQLSLCGIVFQSQGPKVTRPHGVAASRGRAEAAAV
jgi:hypothetical protein